MSASATASLTLKLNVIGSDQLRALASTLSGLGKVSRVAGDGGLGPLNARMAASTREAGAAVKGIRSLEQEMARLEQKSRQAAVTEQARTAIMLKNRDILTGRTGVTPLRTVEGEMTRLQRQAENRRATEQARAHLGMDATGGFLAGHGFANRPRQVLGLLRDMTIAGMGVRYAMLGTLGAVNAMVTPVREFEKSMQAVRVKGDFSLEQNALVAAAARRMGRTTQFSAAEAAAAAIPMAASNIKAPAIAANMGTVLRFALGGDLGTEKAAETLTETAAQFKLGTDDFGHIGDVLVKSANMSTISVDDMSESLRYLGSFAGGMKVPLEEVSAMLALIGQRGIKGSLGGTALRQMLVGLTTPARQAKKAMAELGYTTEDLNAGLADIPGFMVKLDKDMERLGMTTPQKGGIIKRLFGVESISAVQAMIEGVMDEGTTGWKAYRGALNDVNGETERAADLMGNTLDGKIRKLNAKVEDLKITFGEKLAPVLTDRVIPALEAVTIKMSDAFGSHGAIIETAAVTVPTAFAGLLTAGVASWSLSIGKSLAVAAGGEAWGLAFMAAAGPVMTAGVAIAIATAIGQIGGEQFGGWLHDLFSGGMAGFDQFDWRGGSRASGEEIAIRGRMAKRSAAWKQQQADLHSADPVLRNMAQDSLMDQYGAGDPILENMRADAPRSITRTPWQGLMKIEITQEGKARVKEIISNGPDVQVEAPVGETVAP